MPSIVNGLFAGRGGLNSHGIAIATVGDNISNASTIGYKTSRTEFEDLVAGGTAGKIVGSGSSVSAITTVFEQGTLEITGRDLDLAIDGNGYFVVQDNGAQYYTRAGNFKVNAEGYIVTQNNLDVMGFPAGGSGALERLNINSISQSGVNTENVVVRGNLDARPAGTDISALPDNTPALGGIPLAGVDPDTFPSRNSYTDLAAVSEFQTTVEVFDTLGGAHTVTFFFFKEAGMPNSYHVRGYVDGADVDDPNGNVYAGEPRQISATTANLVFTSNGALDVANSVSPVLTTAIPWNNGSDQTQTIDFDLRGFTQFSTPSGVLSITQDGQGVGTVTSINIEENGDIFAVLDNGQTAIVGAVGMANFSNPEGLSRVGKQLLQESTTSGEPIVGRAGSGTFGNISSGSLELSTTDIAAEFVKLITLQRGFQANSRIITTINQLLNEIINLA